MRCEKCGAEVKIGGWPWCPHEPARFHVDAFEPRHDEHLATDGLTYTSNREKIRYMDRNGIVEKQNPHATSLARGATGKLLFFDMGHK